MEKNQKSYYENVAKPYLDGFVSDAMRLFNLDLNELPLPQGTLKRALAEYRAYYAMLAMDTEEHSAIGHLNTLYGSLVELNAKIKRSDENDRFFDSMLEAFRKLAEDKNEYFGQADRDISFTNFSLSMAMKVRDAHGK